MNLAIDAGNSRVTVYTRSHMRLVLSDTVCPI